MIAFLLIWFGIGLLYSPFTYAMSFGYWQKKYAILSTRDYREDVHISLIFAALGALAGPFEIIISIHMFKPGKYGMKWK